MPGTKVVDGKITCVDGQQCTISAVTQRKCYVSVWYIGSDGTVERDFPKGAQSSLLVPGEPRDLVRFVASPSTGREFFHIVASNRPLEELTDQQLEAYVTEEREDGNPRERVRIDEKEPAVAEFYIEFHADPPKASE